MVICIPRVFNVFIFTYWEGEVLLSLTLLTQRLNSFFQIKERNYSTVGCWNHTFEVPSSNPFVGLERRNERGRGQAEVFSMCSPTLDIGRKAGKERHGLFDFACCLWPLDCTTSHTVWFNPVCIYQLCSLPVHQLFHAIFRKQILSGKYFFLVHIVKIFQPYPFSFMRNNLRNVEGLKMNLWLVD